MNKIQNAYSNYKINTNPLSFSSQKKGLSSCALEKDTVSFGNSNASEIENLKSNTGKEFFKKINLKYPDKCKVLLNNEAIIRDIENGSPCYFSDSSRLVDYNAPNVKALENAINKLSKEEIEDVIEKIDERLPDTKSATYYYSGLTLYASDKEAFDYVMSTPFVYEDCICSSGYSKDFCRLILNNPAEVVQNINLQVIDVIERDWKSDYSFVEYTQDSDLYKASEKHSKEMHDYLSEYKTTDDMTAYRGEMSTWMFDSIPLDSKMAKKVKMIAFLNPASRKDLVYPNNNRYSNYNFDSTPFKSIYETIMSKENLTLADAMLVTKYGNNGFINEVLGLINSASVEDENFKSFTLSERFANEWINRTSTVTDDHGSLTTIVQRANIKAGSEAGYSIKSSQYEVILNDNLKEMSFKNAKYDKEKDIFYIDSEIESINS